MPQFLKVKDAARHTGKSPSSIRRIIYDILPDDHHPDRQHIEPSVEEAKQLRSKGENFPWKISLELLDRVIPAGRQSEKVTDATFHRTSQAHESQLLAMLQRELDTKNQQIAQQSEMIAKQMELTAALGERLREGNVILHALQQQLSLPQGTTRSSIVDVQRPAHEKREGAAVSKKSSKAASKQKAKRRFFSWF